MNFWSGWGFLVPVTAVLALFICMVGAGVLGLPHNLGMALSWVLSGFVAGGAIFLMNWSIEQSGKPRVLVDRVPHRHIVMRPSAGEFLFIPALHWAIILPALGVLMGIVALLGLT